MSGRGSPSRKGPGQGRGGRAAAGRKSGPPRSRGAGRTGAVKRPDATPTKRGDKGLGGEQIEGRQAVRELLLAQRRKVREVWISSELQDTDAVDDIVAIAAANRVPVSYVARKRLEMTARTDAPQGVLAIAAPLQEADLAQFLRRRGGRPPFLVAVDGVTDPGNLGAIVRSCDGAGVDLVVVPRHRAVHVTPTVAKASAGAIEHVPIAVVSGLPSALQRMRDAGIWVVGLDDAADRSLFDIADLAVEAICVVLGAEGAGLSRLVRERCDMIVGIPMAGRLSSLNVSAAAALATYEVARHRTTDQTAG
ncbi:MAG TPA: 23S rRNA (guanosine(2251)-2'-O)-methyltransferase RlmB [Ilumatobacter sp.]